MQKIKRHEAKGSLYFISHELDIGAVFRSTVNWFLFNLLKPNFRIVCWPRTSCLLDGARLALLSRSLTRSCTLGHIWTSRWSMYWGKTNINLVLNLHEVDNIQHMH